MMMKFSSANKTATPLRMIAMFIAVTAIHAQDKDEKILATFKDEASAKGWSSVNDDVMGGVSKGGFERTDRNTLLFKGELSLENNGGFASIRSKPKAVDLSDMKALAVRAKGDGRTYWIELRVSDQMRASSYRADFPTKSGEWQDLVIPLDNFKLQAFGQFLPSKPIKLEDVQSVGFTIADKKAGDFELEIESVKAVSETQKWESTNRANGIVEVAKGAGQFKTLLAAATAADLVGVLSGSGPFTVFAPTDEAFAKLPQRTVRDLLKPENKEKLTEILKYHVIAGKVNLSTALAEGQAKTLQGSNVVAKFEDGSVRINSAKLLSADIAASNGLIHVIDQVILPPSSKKNPLTASEMIELAIDRGVPLFNDGNEAACVAVYEIACESLLAMPKTSKESRLILSEALAKIAEQKSDRRNAWTLRTALDEVYKNLHSSSSKDMGE